jgi:hypothetical protein
MFTSDGDGVVSNIVYSGNDVTLCDMREISPLLLVRMSQLFVWVAWRKTVSGCCMMELAVIIRFVRLYTNFLV